jgi:hypothetical protein
VLPGDQSAPAGADPGWPSLLATLVVHSALYGAALGAWHGAQLAFYAAIKLPLVLLLTALLTAAFNLLLGRLLGLAMAVHEAARLAIACLARAAALLGALAPVAALYSLSAPPPGLAARSTHNLLYLLHTGLVGASGLAAVVQLRRRVGAVATTPHAARLVLCGWIVSFALVGSEIAWALRPFVGSVYLPVTFLRHDALDGNVFEFVFTDIAPDLFSSLASGDPE